MVAKCCVRGCGATYAFKNVRLHKFPKDEEYIKKWMDFCENPKINVQTGRICGRHFDASCRQKRLIDRLLGTSPKRGRGVRGLSEDAIPTLFRPKPEEPDEDAMVAAIPPVQGASRSNFVSGVPRQEEQITNSDGTAQTPVVQDDVIRQKIQQIIEDSKDKSKLLDSMPYVIVKGSLWKENREKLEKLSHVDEELKLLKSELAARKMENQRLVNHLKLKEETFNEERKQFRHELQTTQSRLKAVEERVRELETANEKLKKETDDLRNEGQR